VSTGKLTRQELGWLLTQEAQGAAERLRRGVQVLKSNAPPALESGGAGGVPPVDATLDALDEAMRMLSSIHKVPSAGRGRRGRIDLASLMWEVAPEARVSIEPGGGTEISGDEAEIRRMMHLLIGHGSGAGSAVTVRREGDEVRVSVVLGPDSSATADTERAWLSRMAIRYGGRHELEGGMEVISLPADGAVDAKERDLLRKELDEARKQGEAYARELAQAFAQGEGRVSPSTFPPMSPAPEGEPVGTLARFSRGVSAELRTLVGQLGRDLHAIRPGAALGSSRGADGDPEDRLEGVKRRLRDVQEVVAELSDLGEIDPTEPKAELDLVELTRVAVRALAGQLERTGVELSVVTVPADAPGLKVPVRLSPRAASYIVKMLIAQAIAATSRGNKVRVTVVSGASSEGVSEGSPPGAGARLLVDDAGASLPSSARKAFVALEVEPSTYGRPSSVSLFVCSELAAWQGALVELGDAPLGGLRIGLHLPRITG